MGTGPSGGRTGLAGAEGGRAAVVGEDGGGEPGPAVTCPGCLSSSAALLRVGRGGAGSGEVDEWVGVGSRARAGLCGLSPCQAAGREDSSCLS